MKKFLKITGIILLVIIVLLAVLPVIFKGKINEIVKEQINKNVNAKVDYKDFSLGILSSFPDFKFTLNDLSVVGINEFKGDTLLTFKALKISLDLISVIKMDEIKIKAIILDEPHVHAVILPNGKANWDIAKPSTDTAKADTTETKFNLQLKKFEIAKANIVYDDLQGKMNATLQNFNLLLTGDFSQDFTSMDITSNTDFVNVTMDGIKYLKNAAVKFNIAADADMKNSKYTLKNNEFSINDLTLGWNGTVVMKDSDIITDLVYATKKTTFKSILSLVPAVYMKDFESVKTAGSLKLNGFVKGTYNSKVMPNVGLTLLVENAMFKYPDLPKSVDNININAKVMFDGVQNDNTTIDVNKFHFEISGNPFDMALNVKTPMSDPSVNAKFKGSLDLSSVNQIVPLDSMTLKGLVNMDLDVMGQMSMLEKEKYEEFKAAGSIKLSGFEYVSPDFPQGFYISHTTLNFTPKVVDLTEFEATFGKSDISLKGKLMNFIPYVFNNKTVKGELTLTSDILDLNQFLSGSEETPAPADTAQLSLVEVPKNIDFTIKANIAQIYYEKMVIKDLAGKIIVIDGKAVLEKLNMNMLEGSLILSGEYNTQNLMSPFVDLDFKINEFDIPATFVAFNTVKKLAPIAENAKGKFSLGMNFRSFLDKHMNPVMNSIVGGGNFASKSIEIVNSKTFSRIADAMKNDDLKHMRLDNVAFNFEIKDGRVSVEPFDTKMGKTNLNIRGYNGLDQSLEYFMNISMPRSGLGAGANQIAANLLSQAASKGVAIKDDGNINFKIKVFNTVMDPKVTLDLGVESAAKNAKEQVKEAVKEKVEDVKAKAKEAANQKAQQILAAAQKESDQIKATAAQLAEAAKKQTYVQADNMDKQVAGQPKFARDVAKKSSDKVRREGDNKAQQIINEANQRADGVMQKARTEASNLTK